MIFDKQVRVVLKGEAKKSYLNLKKSNDKQATILLNSLKRVIEILKDNPQFGDPIAKRLIPKKFNKSISNLYRVELSNYWRLLYTLEGNRVEIFVIVLSIADHKTYNKLFGYK